HGFGEGWTITTTNSYDPLGRKTSTTYPNSTSVASAYNTDTNRPATQQVSVDGTESIHARSEYAYTDQTATTGADEASDAVGEFPGETGRPDGTGKTGSADDGNNRDLAGVTSKTVTGDIESLPAVTKTFNAVGELTKETRYNGYTTGYTYTQDGNIATKTASD